MKPLLTYLRNKYENELLILFEKKIVTEEFLIVMNLLKEPLYTNIIQKWEVNVFI
jgi:hypothetical protein